MTLLNSIGRPHLTFYGSVVATVLRAILLLLLVDVLGLHGAAIAVALSLCLEAVFLLRVTMPVVSRQHFFSVAPDRDHTIETMMADLSELRGFGVGWC